MIKSVDFQKKVMLVIVLLRSITLGLLEAASLTLSRILIHWSSNGEDSFVVQMVCSDVVISVSLDLL